MYMCTVYIYNVYVKTYTSSIYLENIYMYLHDIFIIKSYSLYNFASQINSGLGYL